ncbi:unnamed protein product [Gongylonema pulchrum]|uniref:Uncharacterized protein n=1 Tax=Gongylonema pulchrum TaxID=637853 RepID=A0A183DDV1_9BILA|nr:unnamed protein product [Gongylonema pulchrum]
MGKLSPTGSSPVRRTTEPDAGSISSFQRTVNPIGYVRPEAESTSSVDQGTSYFAATAAAAAETTNPTRQDFVQQTEPFGQANDPNQQQQGLYQDDFSGQSMDTSYEYDEEQPMDPQVPTAAPGAAPTSFIRQTVNPNGSVRHGGVNGIIVGCNNVRPFRGRSEDIAEVSGWDQLQDDLSARQSQNTNGSNSWRSDPAESRDSPSQKRLVVDSTANTSDRNNIDSNDDWIQSVVERFPKDSGRPKNTTAARHPSSPVVSRLVFIQYLVFFYYDFLFYSTSKYLSVTFIFVYLMLSCVPLFSVLLFTKSQQRQTNSINT